MSCKYISSGSTFEQDIACSRAVVDCDWMFVSGTIGYDYSSMTIIEIQVTALRRGKDDIA